MNPRLIEIAAGEVLCLRQNVVDLLAPLALRAKKFADNAQACDATMHAARAWVDRERAVREERMNRRERMCLAAFVMDAADFNEDGSEDAQKEPMCSVGTALTAGGTLLMSIKGVLDRYRCDVTDSNGNCFGCAYEDIAMVCAAALESPDVKRVLLVMDTPGGAARGVEMAREALTRLDDLKPVHCYVQDMAASGGLWLASACRTISAAPDAFMGSIGCYAIYPDYSKNLADQGVAVNIFRSHALKAAGLPFEKMNDAQTALIQKGVQEIGDRFMAALVEGRGVDAAVVAKWADTQEFTGNEAVVVGLADAIAPMLSDAIALVEAPAEPMSVPEMPPAMPGPVEPAARICDSKASHGGLVVDESTQNTRGDLTMAININKLKAMEGGTELLAQIQRDAEAKAAESATEKAATLQDLKAAFPGQDSFVLGCLEAGMTMTDAKLARAEQVEKDLAAEKVKNTELAKNAGKVTNVARPGALNTTIPAGTAPGVNAVAGGKHPYLAAIEAHPLYAKDPAAATRDVNHTQPKLVKAYRDAQRKAYIRNGRDEDENAAA